MLLRFAVIAVFVLLGEYAQAETILALPLSLQEQSDQDNRARELALQQTTLAKHDAQRGEKTAAMGRIQKAIELAAQIQGVRKRTVALVDIAAMQAEVGDIQGALQTANFIQSPTERDSTLRIMALDRAKVGDLDNAKLFSNAIQDNWKKTDATSYIDALQSAKSIGY